MALNEDTGLFYAITNSYSESNDLDTAIEISLGDYGDKTPKHLLVGNNILFKSGLKKIALKEALKKATLHLKKMIFLSLLHLSMKKTPRKLLSFTLRPFYWKRTFLTTSSTSLLH